MHPENESFVPTLADFDACAGPLSHSAHSSSHAAKSSQFPSYTSIFDAKIVQLVELEDVTVEGFGCREHDPRTRMQLPFLDTQEEEPAAANDILGKNTLEINFSTSIPAVEIPAPASLRADRELLLPPALHPYAIERFHEDSSEVLIALAHVALAWAEHEVESGNVTNGFCISGLREIQPPPEPEVARVSNSEDVETEPFDAHAPGSSVTPSSTPDITPSEFGGFVEKEDLSVVETNTVKVRIPTENAQAGPSRIQTVVLHADHTINRGRKRLFEEVDRAELPDTSTASVKAGSSKEGSVKAEVSPEPAPTELQERAPPTKPNTSRHRKRPRLSIDSEQVLVPASESPSCSLHSPSPPSHPTPSPAPTGPACGLNNGLCMHPIPTDHAAKKLHLRTHNERDGAAGRFLCTWTGCTESYAHKDNRNKHVMSVHWEVKFQCDVSGCGRVYAREHEVTRHKRTEHHR